MLRFDLPQTDSRYSVWLELQTFEELNEDLRDTAWSLHRTMRRRAAILVRSPFERRTFTHAIPYAALFAAFPHLDPEAVYPIICYD